MLRISILVVFYFLAYEYWLDRSLKDTMVVIVCSMLPTLIENTWRWFKKRSNVSNDTNS